MVCLRCTGVGDCGGAEGGGAEFEGGPEEEVEVEHVVLRDLCQYLYRWRIK